MSPGWETLDTQNNFLTIGPLENEDLDDHETTRRIQA
jgi:hypothetical protein